MKKRGFVKTYHFENVGKIDVVWYDDETFAMVNLNRRRIGIIRDRRELANGLTLESRGLKVQLHLNKNESVDNLSVTVSGEDANLPFSRTSILKNIGGWLLLVSAFNLMSFAFHLYIGLGVFLPLIALLDLLPAAIFLGLGLTVIKKRSLLVAKISCVALFMQAILGGENLIVAIGSAFTLVLIVKWIVKLPVETESNSDNERTTDQGAEPPPLRGEG